jgi:hypothetical protein
MALALVTILAITLLIVKLIIFCFMKYSPPLCCLWAAAAICRSYSCRFFAFNHFFV